MEVLKNLDIEEIKRKSDDEFKMKIINTLEDQKEILEIAKSIEDSSIKVLIFDRLNNYAYKRELAFSIEDEELRFKVAEKYLDFMYKEDVIESIQSRTIREKILKDVKEIREAVAFANSFGELELAKQLQETKRLINNSNSDKQIEIFNKTEYKCIKIKIANLLAEAEDKSPLKKILPQIIEELDNETVLEIINVSAQNDNEDFIQEILSNEKLFDKISNASESYNYMADIIYKMDESTKYEFFKKRKNIDGNLNILKAYLLDNNVEYENIIKELDKIMEIYGISPDKISYKKELLMQMYVNNNDVVKRIDYKLLDNKYLEKIGLDRINLISCYSNIQERVLSLSDKKLNVWIKCIDDYMDDAQTADWTTIADAILNNLCGGEFDELINDIQDEDNIDLDMLRGILQNNNVFEIKSKNDISNYENIKKLKTDELMKSDKITDKKQAVLQKVFGLDYSYARSVAYSYGQDIDSLPECDEKYYVKSLKEILNCNSTKVLEEIYQECKEVTFVDKVMTERNLKTEYGKLYNEGLLKIDDLEKIGNNMYSAGTEFKMIITSLGACRNSEHTENYKEDWNRPYINSQTVSTSYIRNDMLGTAARKRLCYGFNEMLPDSLMEAGEHDIGSATESFATGSTSKKFLTPNTMINETVDYNEMDYRRMQNGKRKQPSYIVVFRMDGEIENLDNAKQAQKDWGDLPIVVVDVNECIKAEREKVNSMIKEYKINPSTKLKKDIYYKIRNNRQFSYMGKGGLYSINFCNDIDIEQFKVEDLDIEISEQIKEKVTKKELKDNYSLVDPKVREEGMNQMKSIFRAIYEIEQEDKKIE